VICSSGYCQKIIEGKIIDAETGKPVPYASIGIIGSSKGTSSNLDGEFSLPVSGIARFKITCIGYESMEIHSSSTSFIIKLKPEATQLKEVVIFNKPVNPKKIVRKAFENVHQNFLAETFTQRYFYRHYCKDDSVYGRLIEAFVDVYKSNGYRSRRNSAGENEFIRIPQLRRSLDNTIMAQGHEPISVGNILQADIIGYQSLAKTDHVSFYSEVNDIKSDFENYSFEMKGLTNYDGQEIYKIEYVHRKDSVLTTSGKYLSLTSVKGRLFITSDNYALVRAEEEKQFDQNQVRTICYYRKYNNHYYPYHLTRQGHTILADNSSHSFRIDLISIDIQNEASEKFVNQSLSKEELLKINYDSTFWANHPVLKTTPLENKIIADLGNGNPLNKQFQLYRQYEYNLQEGDKNAIEKFRWLQNESKGKKILYLFFWANDCRPYLREVEMAKQLQKKYRNKVSFVFLSLDETAEQWKMNLTKYNLSSDGIINYWIGKNSGLEKNFAISKVPGFVLLSKKGEVFSPVTKNPANPLLEKDFELLLK
jgi:thiol-disulfide isomerase/thioredoxin